ncbi:MAG: FHA domain-containing protein [Myxococcota bacterium]
MDSYTLIVTVKGAAPRQLVIDKARATLGREVGDVVVGDVMCSSSHGEFHWDGARCVFRDVGSTNGTYVLGQRVQQVELQPGTILQIGESTVQFVGGAAGRGRTVVAPAVARRTNTPVGTPAVAAASAPKSNRGMLLAVIAILGVGVVGVAGIAAWGLLGKRSSSSTTASSGGTSTGTSKVEKALRAVVSDTPKGGEATVKAVWFRGQPGVKVEGGTADISVRISPNSKDGASVGVIEEFAGGTGNQWRTASWLAAFNASRAVGHSLIEHEYLVRAGGHIDGPSAGMLMTSTMMALLRGKALLPDTTMTGTINPDGSAGPVGGIVQKMHGAKASGIKRFGYPMGARNHVDLSNNTQVDLNDVGAELGLEVKEIHDLSEAYEFMTGEKLERPAPIDDASLELDGETSQRMRAKLTAWKSRLSSEVTQLKESLRKNQVIGRSLNPQLGEIEKLIDRAATYEEGDLPAAALNHYIKAALMVVMTRDSIAFLDSFLRGDLEGINAQVKEATAVAGQVRAYGDELLIRSKRQTVGGQVNTTLAFGSYVGAANFADLGEDGKARANEVLEALRSGKLKPSPEAITYLSKNLMMPIAYYHCAKVMLDMSRDQQDLLGEEGQSSNANLALLGREAGGYGSAAGAALAYFDALITDSLQEEKGMTKAQAQSVVANKEIGYLLARQGVNLTESLKSGEGEGARNLLRLAAGANAYFTAAGLVNKYYALGANERDGEVTITNRKSLIAQLEQARTHAKEAAARAKSVAGFVPIAAKLDYQFATAMRDGSDADKLDALENYWTSAFWSELAAKLASK